MLTTGSKYFFGIGVFGLVAALAYALASGNEFTGMVILTTLGVAGIFLGCVTTAFRDGTVATATYRDGLPEDITTMGHGPIVSPSLWPLLGAFGATVLVLGLVFKRWMVWAGIIILLASIVEWVVQSWSDRASDDAEYNHELRNRLMQPIEFPVLGIAAIGVVVFGFSRLMLSLTKSASVVAFIGIAALILLVIAAMAGFKRIGGGVIIATLMFGVIIAVTVGVISAVHGERGFEQHNVDEGKSTQSVADTANIVGRVELKDSGLQPSTIAFPRSIQASLTFTNLTSEERRLVVTGDNEVNAQGQTTNVPHLYKTPFAKDGQTEFVTVRITKPGSYPYYTEARDGSDRLEGTIVVS